MSTENLKYDQEARYTENDEWARKDGDLIVCGISDYAQDQLSDIVYVEFPSVGDSVAKGDAYGVVESVKAASDLYAPVGGEVVEVNEELADSPEIVNKDPYGQGWIIKIQPSAPAEWDSLTPAGEYEQAKGDD